MSDDLPDPGERRPSGLDDTTVEALGKLSEALETVQRARGHLYTFHQLTGHAHLQLEEAVSLLRAAGHDTHADALTADLLGRDVLPGRWTFQVVEEYDDGYYRCFTETEERLRNDLAKGRRHIYESEMKRRLQR
ncbi:hypothetical protein Skr01_40970 [Sphaerisporangium krabiense]|uniref:Uncharacterized protein n=1 Tax=Sphaerisporangium krabiense TaxID=763782 RepID=A0A7W8Z9F6_9ACTN|nr:hypothetical protein [Sphaerisporangium krabiense]MBB5629911.1 hypothetical protein [Sphaerisporangium krabiense]GII64012.1 hypothetical protein Skr01_40970 [Sphaerisporangium krabiense]